MKNTILGLFFLTTPIVAQANTVVFDAIYEVSSYEIINAQLTAPLGTELLDPADFRCSEDVSNSTVDCFGNIDVLKYGSSLAFNGFDFSKLTSRSRIQVSGPESAFSGNTGVLPDDVKIRCEGSICDIDVLGSSLFAVDQLSTTGFSFSGATGSSGGTISSFGASAVNDSSFSGTLGDYFFTNFATGRDAHYNVIELNQYTVPVPLPASGLLMLGAFGILARKKRKTSA
ncbi:MAG: VPLPA-CTERM sorting domain-containing protein [Paracoccaceae bacterium]